MCKVLILSEMCFFLQAITVEKYRHSVLQLSLHYIENDRIA